MKYIFIKDVTPSAPPFLTSDPVFIKPGVWGIEDPIKDTGNLVPLDYLICTADQYNDLYKSNKTGGTKVLVKEEVKTPLYHLMRDPITWKQYIIQGRFFGYYVSQEFANDADFVPQPVV